MIFGECIECGLLQNINLMEQKKVYLNIRYKVAHIHSKMGRLALLCSAYIQVSGKAKKTETMKAKIYSNTLLIGTSDLQIGDESMGCVFGEFIPNENYFKHIQKQVWNFWKVGCCKCYLFLF